MVGWVAVLTSSPQCVWNSHSIHAWVLGFPLIGCHPQANKWSQAGQLGFGLSSLITASLWGSLSDRWQPTPHHHHSVYAFARPCGMCSMRRYALSCSLSLLWFCTTAPCVASLITVSLWFQVWKKVGDVGVDPWREFPLLHHAWTTALWASWAARTVRC